MRTRSRFVLLFALLGLVVMVVGLVAIYRAVAIESAKRLPVEAERLLAEAAALSLDESLDAELRLRRSGEALVEARALLTRGRIMVSDPVIGLAIQVAAILGAVLLAAALVFSLLSRVITRGIDELVAGVERASGDRLWRLPASGDPEFGRVREAVNDLLELVAEQERRLEAGARLEGWREVASFLAHQIKNPLAALSLAAENGSLALETGPGREAADKRQREMLTSREPGEVVAAGVHGEVTAGTVASSDAPRVAIARESLSIVKEETARLSALIDRFRDLAPAGLEAYSGGSPIVLRGLLEGCAARIRAAGATAIVEVPEGPEVSVVADRALLEQALWNLFSNSLEAAGAGPVTIRATVLESDGEEGGMVRVTLRDTNNCIDPGIVATLGVARHTTKRGGTGLGLILVRRVLALQGGRLELALEGGGLVARISLPKAGNPPQAVTLPQAATLSQAVTSPQVRGLP